MSIIPPELEEDLPIRRRHEIYAEEVYREAARSWLNSSRPKGRSAKLLEFLNSSLGIFLCSTIFVSLFSFAFTSWRAMQQRRHADAILTRKLDTEIAFRLRELHRIVISTGHLRYSDLMQIVRVLEGEERFYLHKPIFPEYKKRNMAVLLWQLGNTVPSEERQVLNSSFRATLQLNDYLKDLRNEAMEVSTDDDDCWWTNEREHTALIRLIEQSSRESRWSLAMSDN